MPVPIFLIESAHSALPPAIKVQGVDAELGNGTRRLRRPLAPILEVCEIAMPAMILFGQGFAGAHAGLDFAFELLYRHVLLHETDLRLDLMHQGRVLSIGELVV